MSEEETPSNQVTENIPEAGGEQAEGDSGSANPKDTDCIFWQRGECTKGDECPFKHDPAKRNIAASRPVCKFFEMGYCDKGNKCPFRHVKRPHMGGGMLAMTMMQMQQMQQQMQMMQHQMMANSMQNNANSNSQKPICHFWKEGRCNKGASCPFRHPDLSAPSEAEERRKKTEEEALIQQELPARQPSLTKRPREQLVSASRNPTEWNKDTHNPAERNKASAPVTKGRKPGKTVPQLTPPPSDSASSASSEEIERIRRRNLERFNKPLPESKKRPSTDIVQEVDAVVEGQEEEKEEQPVAQPPSKRRESEAGTEPTENSTEEKKPEEDNGEELEFSEDYLAGGNDDDVEDAEIDLEDLEEPTDK